MLPTPQTAGVTRPNSNIFSHSDILLTFRLREESRRREIEEYERAIEEIDQEEARLKEEIHRIEGEMAESDRRHAKRWADRRNRQPKQETKPHKTVEPRQHGTNLVDDPMTVPQPSPPCQLIPSGPSIPPVPVSWPPVPANWTQCPAPPPVIWPPVLINWAYPVQLPTSPIFPPPIPFLNLPSPPPPSPQQADNFSAAPQIYPLALELLPETQKRSKANGKKYQGGCPARARKRNNPVQSYCGGGDRGESQKRRKDIGTSRIPAEPDGVMGNNTSITLTIPGVWIDMDSDVEVEVDGSGNSNSDENSDADESSSEEESSGEEENSDSDEESK
ncbi:hypothetical protein K435DRAFT_860387 [Dendrothele bispora CBS 962.96]|uniref:Uncharacterized protein n=1 Tax=Dendrothele bispora (strain CBS 962.96) TaxID=1314807 RepID=A0A4S8LZ96_DENBC|nr:hypothetical protein K435DRAFT_860387 [Dendrothele bispora CBS 962.96]